MLKYIKIFDNVFDWDSWYRDISQDKSCDEYPFVALAKDNANDHIMYSPAKTVINNGQSYVDLGLPSGTLWASSDITSLRLWGEMTAPQKNVYIYKDGSGNMTKYNNSDGLINLELNDDIAHVTWGGDWMIPSVEDWEELQEYTTYTNTGGSQSQKLFTYTSTINGNSIEFRWCGQWYYSSYNYSAGNEYRWTSQRDGANENNAMALNLTTNTFGSCSRKDYGFAVRPIIKPVRKDYTIPPILL